MCDTDVSRASHLWHTFGTRTAMLESYVICGLLRSTHFINASGLVRANAGTVGCKTRFNGSSFRGWAIQIPS